MGRAALVVGYSWTEGAPVLRVRMDGAWVVRDLPLVGRLLFRVTPERRCVGYSTGAGLAPCPDGALPLRSQCAACERRDAFRPCMTCDGFRCPPLSPQMKERCERVHHLYLACFGGDRLKVGTASHMRRDQRIIEQGPLAAARVARGPGPLIKQMEHLLASDEEFVESMRRERKAALLAGSMTLAEARRRVDEAAGSLRRRLAADYHPLIHPPQWVADPPLAERARGWSVVPLQIGEDTRVEGRIVGAIGHLVFVEEDAGRFALDLADLKARVIALDPGDGGRKPVVQLGLFKR